MAERFCRVCSKWHDLNEPWPEACMSHYRRDKHDEGPQIVKDIEPYRAVGLPGQPIIGGRRQHIDALRAHNKIEVGNERVERRPVETTGHRESVLRAWREHGGQ